MVASSAVGCAACRHRAQWLREEASTVDEWFDPGGLEPTGDLVGMEAYAPPPPHLRDPPLIDQPPNVPVGYAEVLRELGDVDEMREAARLAVTLLAASFFHTPSTCIEYPRTR